MGSSNYIVQVCVITDSSSVSLAPTVINNSNQNYFKQLKRSFVFSEKVKLYCNDFQIPDCWENVGIQLEIPQPQLNAIRMKISNGGIANNFFKDVFIHWEMASETDSPYSWKTFLEALSSSFVNKTLLADRIAEELRERKK